MNLNERGPIIIEFIRINADKFGKMPKGGANIPRFD